MLETSELKRLDKQEKETITTTGGTVKGKKLNYKNKNLSRAWNVNLFWPNRTVRVQL